MKLRSWPVLVVAFGILVALIAISGIGALRRARQIYSNVSALYESYRSTNAALNEVRSDIQVAALLTRDFLLDPSNITADRYRAQLRQVRGNMRHEVEELRNLLGTEDARRLDRLSRELDGYWASMQPLFEWTPRQKLALSSLFLRTQVLPRHDAAVAIADEIRSLTQANLERQQAEVDRRRKDLPVYIGRMLAVTLLLGLLVAGASIYRITRLEGRSEEQRGRAELAERELRRLSQQQVKAQEEERKSISRELHDEVGQMLTALRMELGNLEHLRSAPEAQFDEHIRETKELTEQALRAVRHLAMGLRPSMLDDLGLGAAVQWQAREFSRHSGVPVSVQVGGALKTLPELHRTCIYRVVQEALTNCARHAQATDIRVTLHGDADWLAVTVQDDGLGFDVKGVRGRGLGLIGIEERVRELGGEISISSQHGKGTVLSARVPQAKEIAIP